MAIRRQISLFLVATQFLTRLPVPALPGFEPAWLTRSARYFPLVGGLVGAINVGVWFIAGQWLPSAIAIGLMMAASLLVTGAFHEDGFADTCDGLGGGATRERALVIMKDSRIGAYGAIGIGMMLALKWISLAALPAAAFAVCVVAAHVISRWCALGLIWGLRYVRPEADGKARPLADSLSTLDALLSGLMGAIAVLPWLWTGGAGATLPALHAAAFGLVAALLTALVSGAYFRERLGGYTGDCLGATQQLSELAFLLAAVATLRQSGTDV